MEREIIADTRTATYRSNLAVVAILLCECNFFLLLPAPVAPPQDADQQPSRAASPQPPDEDEEKVGADSGKSAPSGSGNGQLN